MNQLNSLRFIAILFIFLFHARQCFGMPDNYIVGNMVAAALTFFFFLSGFILAYRYQNIHSLKEILNFYKNRLAHLWPLHIFLLLITIILFGNFKSIMFLENLFLVQAWIPAGFESYFSYNAVTWCISALFFCYLLFPFILMLGKKKCLIANVIFIILLLILIDVFKIVTVPFSRNAISVHYLVTVFPPTRSLVFILGICTYDIWNQYKYKKNKYSTWIELFAVTVACLFIPFFRLPDLISGAPATRLYLYSSHTIFILPLLLYIFASGYGIISKILKFRFLIFLGEMSFAVYMSHQLLIRFVVGHIELSNKVPVWRQFVALVVIDLLISYILWTFIENPFRKIIKKL